MTGQTMITSETLMTRIGAPDAPALIDVCIDEDFALDPRLIPGAFRHPFAEIATLAASLEGKEAVIICQKGLKLSQGAAALLCARGVAAKALTGGMVEWAANGFPAIPVAAAPKPRIVTAERPSPEALAAIWLIRRFVDRDAEFLFVSEGATDAVAEKFDATLAPAFADALNSFGLASPALRHLHDALTGDAPETFGLTMILAGLRALHPDDLSYFAASLPLFDALHRAFADASEDGMGAAT